MSDLCLTGYRHSVYTRSVRIALAELGLNYRWRDIDPFDDAVALHPFGQVPVLEDGAWRVYETWAILTYLEAQYGKVSSRDARHTARAAQVASIASAHAYWPLVRQVYAHAVVRPAMAETTDGAEVTEGLARAVAVLDALEEIANEALVLDAVDFGPADWFLFPMIDAFARVADARALLLSRPKLNDWWTVLAARRTVSDTFTPLEAET